MKDKDAINSMSIDAGDIEIEHTAQSPLSSAHEANSVGSSGFTFDGGVGEFAHRGEN